MRCKKFPGDSRSRCGEILPAMRPHNVKTLAMRCRDAGHSAPKAPKNTEKALRGALRARCPKALKKHSVPFRPRPLGTPGRDRKTSVLKGALQKGDLHKIVRKIDCQVSDKFATILRTLLLMYGTKYRQFCANVARNLRQICATPPLANAPFSGFLIYMFREPNQQRRFVMKFFNKNV